MNADDIGAEGFHFLEVFYNGGPLFLPVVLDEPAGIIVVVIESPCDELSAGFSTDEVGAIFANTDELKLLCRSEGLGGSVAFCRAARVN